MIDRILGKDIGKYVKKYRLLMVFTIIPAVFTAMLAVIPVILTESFIDDGMMRIGDEPSASDRSRRFQHDLQWRYRNRPATS